MHSSKEAASKAVPHAVSGFDWLAPSGLDTEVQELVHRYVRCCRLPLWDTRGPPLLGYNRGDEM
jgi:hypothetical protein